MNQNNLASVRTDTWTSYEFLCMSRIWRILGKKWTLPLLQSLGSRETTRFGELKKELPDISNTMLSTRLLELEREGLVTKNVCSTAPPKVEYMLTASTRDLGAMLMGLGKWYIRRHT